MSEWEKIKTADTKLRMDFALFCERLLGQIEETSEDHPDWTATEVLIEALRKVSRKYVPPETDPLAPTP